jgi:hypothetical protein
MVTRQCLYALILFPSKQVLLGVASTAAAPALHQNAKALIFTTSFASRDVDSFPI